MSDLNRCILSGRIVTDPDLHHTSGGRSVTSFRFASNRAWRDQAGALQEDALFVDVELWGPQAETLTQWKGKGAFLILDGSLRLQQWQSKEGERRSRIVLVPDNVIFGPANGGKAQAPAGAPAQPAAAPAPAGPSREEDEVPF